MITAIILCHPQSINSLPRRVFNSKLVEAIRISCGTTRIKTANYSESNDFSPSYASLNSALFETSVILTTWEHADQLIGNNHVAVLHTDIVPHYSAAKIWTQVEKWIEEKPARAIGLTAPITYKGIWDEWLIPPQAQFIPRYDPMRLHDFAVSINTWDYIKTYDNDIYQWAMDTQPQLIYSHQFACSRSTFDVLGERLHQIVNRLRLKDIGLWTPHMFERLIALYLAKIGGEPILSTAFWHHSSSGTTGPGTHSLYGPRPFKYYRITTRYGKN